MAECRTPVVHTLKVLPKYFAAVCAGTKRAELRRNDRDYQVGDVLQLVETLPDTDMTGKSVCVRITHVADVSDYAPGYVLLSIAQVWIPCSVRLPVQDVPVLVYFDGGYADVVSINYRGTWDDGNYFHDLKGVTHWMPLPEPPVNVTVKE